MNLQMLTVEFLRGNSATSTARHGVELDCTSSSTATGTHSGCESFHDPLWYRVRSGAAGMNTTSSYSHHSSLIPEGEL